MVSATPGHAETSVRRSKSYTVSRSRTTWMAHVLAKGNALLPHFIHASPKTLAAVSITRLV
ncbi:hypothetical protein IAQ61_009565 [Plenodomus lingam]|uniref:uncharacterized protein n=1 Tax=Leptosphaeria maculans TaxID=5022 RepID=UPI00331D9160|nr:hypothetical protein IAQ61_009565 [Plenodomus lingam]